MKLILRYEGEDVEAEVVRRGSSYEVKLGDRHIDAELVVCNQYLRSLRIGETRQYLVEHHADGNEHEVSFGDQTISLQVFDPLTLRRKMREDETGGGGAIRALMPGRVVKLFVAEGETVRKGQGLLILEAMKMENEITAPGDGVVSSILVTSGQTVEGGAELLVIEAPPKP